MVIGIKTYRSPILSLFKPSILFFHSMGPRGAQQGHGPQAPGAQGHWPQGPGPQGPGAPLGGPLSITKNDMYIYIYIYVNAFKIKCIFYVEKYLNQYLKQIRKDMMHHH